AEQRLTLATKIDAQLEAIAATLSEFYDLGVELARYFRADDERMHRKLAPQTRLDLAFGRVLKHAVPSTAMGCNPIDPRSGMTLTEMERTALGPLLITPAAANRLAELRIA